MPKKLKAPTAAEADTIAVYAHLMIGSRDVVKRAQRKHSALVKEAKQNGVAWPEIAEVLAILGQTPEARAAKTERLGRTAQAIGAPVQLELFEMPTARVNDVEADAERKGFYDAIVGQDELAPYPPGSSEGQAWLRGYRRLGGLIATYNARFEQGEPEPFQAAIDDEVVDELPN